MALLVKGDADEGGLDDGPEDTPPGIPDEEDGDGEDEEDDRGNLDSSPDEPPIDDDDGAGSAGTDACNLAQRSSFLCFAAAIAICFSVYFFEHSSTRLESSSMKILSTFNVKLLTVGFQWDWELACNTGKITGRTSRR